MAVSRHNLRYNTITHADGTEDNEMELYCLSTDEKPTDVPNSVPIMEMDTGKVSIFDADNKKWWPISRTQ